MTVDDLLNNAVLTLHKLIDKMEQDGTLDVTILAALGELTAYYIRKAHSRGTLDADHLNGWMQTFYETIEYPGNNRLETLLMKRNDSRNQIN